MTGILNRWIKTAAFFHIIFWISIFLTFFVDIIEYLPFDIIAFSSSIFIRMTLLFCLIYGNLYLLVPKLYQNGKILLYWLCLIAGTLLFAIIYQPIYLKTTTVLYEIPHKGRFMLNILLAVRYLFVSYLFIFVKGWFEQEKKMSEMQITQLGTELKYLRAQINPHFLFNTLNNIYGLALKKSDHTPEMVMRLSEMMDYMLYDTNEEKVPLKKDIENLVNYVELEKVRQGNHAKIDFTINGEPDGKKIIPLLLLPLLENGFKHGINKESVNAYLYATLDIQDTVVTFTVTNNIVSPKIKMGNNHGIGLENLKKRLSLYYSGQHSLALNKSKDNFIVKLSINLL